jgi:hypothetical protein
MYLYYIDNNNNLKYLFSKNDKEIKEINSKYNNRFIKLKAKPCTTWDKEKIKQELLNKN